MVNNIDTARGTADDPVCLSSSSEEGSPPAAVAKKKRSADEVEAEIEEPAMQPDAKMQATALRKDSYDIGQETDYESDDDALMNQAKAVRDQMLISSSSPFASCSTSVAFSDTTSRVFSSFAVGHKFGGSHLAVIGESLVFVRDHCNEHDSNAIRILVESGGQFIGYLPADKAEVLAPVMDKKNVVLEGIVTGTKSNFVLKEGRMPAPAFPISVTVRGKCVPASVFAW